MTDDTLDILLEESDDEAPVVVPRRVPWRWILAAGAVVAVAGAAAGAGLVAWPWVASMRTGMHHGAVVPPARETPAKGEARWDGMLAPTGPDVVGGEAGIPAGGADALPAPDPDAELPLGEVVGRCGYEAEEPTPEMEGLRVVHGTLGSYGSLYGLLQKNGLGPGVIAAVSSALEKVTDPQSMRAEDAFALYIEEATGRFRFLALKRSDTKIYHVVAFESGTVDAHKVTVPTERRWVKAGGAVHGSLFESVRDAGLDGSVVNHFMAILGAYVKFATDTRDGDTFRVVVSGEWLGKQFLSYDPPQIVEYAGQKTGELVAIYYEASPGKGKYYWPDGTSLKRLVAEVPLSTLRITSEFDPGRLHPILKVRKPHNGTDFGAPPGTPVLAFDGGVVKVFGLKGPMGNMVHIDHGGGVQTYYGHLSGFAKGLKVGGKVAKGQTIGYVGDTGRSTGPHLHFSLKKNGVFVDPMKYLKVTTIKESPIESALRQGFEQRARTLLGMIKAIEVPALPVVKAPKKAGGAAGMEPEAKLKNKAGQGGTSKVKPPKKGAAEKKAKGG